MWIMKFCSAVVFLETNSSFLIFIPLNIIIVKTEKKYLPLRRKYSTKSFKLIDSWQHIFCDVDSVARLESFRALMLRIVSNCLPNTSGGPY